MFVLLLGHNQNLPGKSPPHTFNRSSYRQGKRTETAAQVAAATPQHPVTVTAPPWHLAIVKAAPSHDATSPVVPRVGQGHQPKPGHSWVQVTAGPDTAAPPAQPRPFPSRRAAPAAVPVPRGPAPRYLLAVLAVPRQAHLPVAALAHGPQEAVGSQGHSPASGPGQRPLP